MPTQPSLPPWLRSPAARTGSRGRALTGVRNGAAAVVLLALGGAAGYLLHQPEPAAAPPPTPVACPEPPPPPACPAPNRRATVAQRHTDGRKKIAAAAAPLQPLPEQKPMDDDTRAKALRAFAEKKAPELRDCLAEPDRGPPKNLGAAFEIDAKGAVDSVQILGSDGTSATVRTCYTKRLKRWRFPEELLRGEEKLLVNFVL